MIDPWANGRTPVPPRTESKRGYIIAGEVRVGRAGEVLSTVLGSCVSICLWSREHQVGGLNHFLLPRAGAGERDLKFGDVAFANLLNEVLASGTTARGLIAKVFGGAASGRHGYNVGAQNVLLAWEVLERARIPIVASDVGGRRGRHLDFELSTGAVRIRYLSAPEVP